MAVLISDAKWKIQHMVCDDSAIQDIIVDLNCSFSNEFSDG